MNNNLECYTEEDMREAIDMARMISHIECIDKDHHKIKYSNDEDDIIENIYASKYFALLEKQKERMYNEEDLKSAFFNGGDMKDIEEFNYWLEQFKKKQ